MSSKEKEFLKNTYQKIIDAVQPEALYNKYLHVFDNTLYYKNTVIDMDTPGKLILAGSGKASISMGKAILPYLTRKPNETLFISPLEPPDALLKTMKGDHPIPGENSLRAGKSMLALIDSLNENDTLIYFLSGGSSSLLEYPISGTSITDIQDITKIFLSSGMTIDEMNILRSALSQVKNGMLGERCKAKSYVFGLSDVMGNDFSVIGSGPFWHSCFDVNDIEELIFKYRLKDVLGEYLDKLYINYELIPFKDDTPHYLIGSNMDLLEAAELICFDESIRPLTFPESLFGEAKQAGKMIADMLKYYSGPRPTCMIFGGETTVTLNDDPGKGGRAQELALSVLEELKDMPEISILSAGSDGMDGIGGAAGAIVNAHTYKKAESLDLSIQDYLDKHDSYHFHKQCDSLIVTGYSGTNVGDVVLALIE
ncbi:MAG: DUF4147 domain-containing protein [Candidatus Marinimicrobia bacterium]|nr:DUF4147 domain-containing protein [Candidatus Neomarinimicrobiota bacterium]